MWIEDVKDNSIVQEMVRIAGREGRESAERQGRLEERRSTVIDLLQASRGLDDAEAAIVASMSEPEVDAVHKATLAYVIDKAKVDVLSLIDNALAKGNHPAFR